MTDEASSEELIAVVENAAGLILAVTKTATASNLLKAI
jgi:hypothetical protein